jgi:alpha-glucuronidase
MKYLFSLALCLISYLTMADDGYRLWLKYDRMPNTELRNSYAKKLTSVSANFEDPTAKVTITEIQKASEGWFGKKTKVMAYGQPATLLLKKAAISDPHTDAFHIKSSNNQIVISGNTSKGVMYGVFELFRRIQTGNSLKNLNFSSAPKIDMRMLNHWDNNNGTIERGYAGMSLWKWYELPERIDPRYVDYARANASIGINGTVLNNVNASARFITDEYLIKVKALADAFRPYGIKVFLSVNFASPKIIGGLPTADPLDPAVRQWWKTKVEDIYKLIPDFGGFVVKANSEGEPGPMDFGRTHKDGANMMAEALETHKGIVIWRAFVYNFDPKGDRFAAAYNEFKKFDGEFSPNVIIQVKNGPIDFQVREPISPLFGAMQKTPVAMEFQLSQEYLGWATHWVFEGPLFEEVLQTDTFANGPTSTVAKVIEGAVFKYPITAMVGVANTGSDRNWTAHPMAQANWYAFGRMAWNTRFTSNQIAEEWVKMTFQTSYPSTVQIKKMMLETREIYANYTNPLGVHHVMGEGHHFGPEPWVEKAPRPDWTALYYHRADSLGIGFNRTSTGSNAIAQYQAELRAQYQNPEKTPLPYLLWFHHVPWSQPLSTGRTLWQEMVTRYYDGANSVTRLQGEWATLKGKIDTETFENVEARLKTQYKEAIWWRDASVLYFQQFSKMAIPAPYQKPNRTLEEVKKLVEVYHIR